MESIKDIIEYIDSNREYIKGIDDIRFGLLKKSIESREKGGSIPPDIYCAWMEEDIAIGRLKQHVEVQKMLAEKQRKEELDAVSKDGGRKKFEELRNIERDSKGRLNQGAKLAKKESCNESKIHLMHEAGATVKEIVAYYGCSKSVVYRVLAKYK